MEEWQLRPGTRVYSTPSDQLILTYYSGLPVQSIAPVRKSFLDESGSDLIIIDTKSWAFELPINETLEEVGRMGLTLSREEARHLENALSVTLLQRRLEGRVAKLWPPASRSLSSLEKRLVAKQASHMKWALGETALQVPILRGYDLRDQQDWWAVFFYRFSNVEARWRENLNYADRIRESVALILPWGWVIYDCGRNSPTIFSSEITARQTFETASRLVDNREAKR